MRALTLTVFVLATYPLNAAAQTASSPLSRGDLTVSLGTFSANHVVVRDGCCDTGWSSSLFKGVAAGFYWTDHLKTEIEAASPGLTEAYGYRTTGYGYEHHSYRTSLVTAGQLYQFGRNAFFHPFLGAGVAVIRERDTNERSTQTGGGRLDTEVTETSQVRARPFATTGFKAYFSERAFFRGEVKVAFASRSGDLDEMVWRAGFGVDF
jgi:outer membrane protein W